MYMRVNKNLLKKLYLAFLVLFIISAISKNGPLFFIFIIILLIYIFNKTNFKNIINKNMSETINLDDLKLKKNFKKISTIIILFVLCLWFFFSSIIIIDAGQTGVYSLFGKVRDSELRSGFHLVIPLARVHKMSIRTEEYTMSIAAKEGKRVNDDSILALTKEGLSVALDITALYKLNEESASEVYKTLGLNYEEKIIRPEIRSSIREVKL